MRNNFRCPSKRAKEKRKETRKERARTKAKAKEKASRRTGTPGSGETGKARVRASSITTAGQRANEAIWKDGTVAQDMEKMPGVEEQNKVHKEVH